MSNLVSLRIEGKSEVEAKIEALAARLYGIDSNIMEDILDAFPKVTQTEREAILNELSGGD